MSNEKKLVADYKTFEELLADAEKSTGYWVELAKLEFTEDILALMEQQDVSKSQLAQRLGVTPALITRLLNGRNNFELATMVRLALALKCRFKPQLQPDVSASKWLQSPPMTQVVENVAEVVAAHIQQVVAENILDHEQTPTEGASLVGDLVCLLAGEGNVAAMTCCRDVSLSAPNPTAINKGNHEEFALTA